MPNYNPNHCLVRPRRLLLIGCALAAALPHLSGHAAVSRRAAAQHPDVLNDLRALAQQRPRACTPSADAAASPPWPAGDTACAWQNRLRRQTWRWNDDAGAPCLSTQARWWHWAQAGLPPAAPRSVWDARWNARTLQLTVGEEQRLLLLRRDGATGWQATEWRWTPNPRPATRRWQEGRWKLLLDAAAQPAFSATVADPSEALRMRPVFGRLLGTRAGEIDQQGLRLQAAGLCLRTSNPLPGTPQLRLAYSPNDSRLEQRAAMHLQLSRLHPNAKWLTQFRMLDMPAKLPSGAKFFATWVEDGQLLGQLWMPMKGDAETVRIRIATALPRRPDAAMAAADKAKPVLERELATLALQWAAAYE